MNRKRALLFAALALAVPLPALALERGEGAAALDVQASLGGCGVADAGISCRIDIAFSRIPDAEYYTASVTAPDGSVVELGSIASGGDGGASASASVPFSGNGEYTVTVSAWGYDERGRAGVVESDRAGADRQPTKGTAGQVEATEPGGQPEPAEDEPPPAPEPVTPPASEEPECPERVDGAEPAPAPGAESDPEAGPGATRDLECEPEDEPAPPEEPVPPAVP